MCSGKEKKPLMQIQHLFMVLTFSKFNLEWNFHIVESTPKICKCEMLETFPIKSTTGCTGIVQIQLFKPGLDGIASIQLYTGIPE